MTRALRCVAPWAVAAFAALWPCVSGAQSVFDSEARLAPQFMQYRFMAPANETVWQLALPVFVTIPVSERLNFDIGTAFTRTRVTTDGVPSEISGLTDTQLRGNLTLGSDFVVLTAGLNLPTGKSSVTVDQFRAAGLIGNDFLAFPISTMGTGLAFTGGVALARPFGDWNLGAGGAVRRSAGYEPFSIPGQTLRFQPGNEYRVRVGVDRAVRAGRVALGLTYSTFGKDDVGGSVYNTGNRLIAQGMYADAFSGREVTFAAYDVFRGRGSYASGAPAGTENIADVFGSIALNSLGAPIEPSVELRHWLQHVLGATSGTTTTADRTQTSMLATLGLRTHVEAAHLRVVPSVGYTIGRLAMLDGTGAATNGGLTGFRAQVAVRVAP
jgi:hypothetical protein